MPERTWGEYLAGSFLPATLMRRVNVARYVSANRRYAVTLATITLPKKVELSGLILANILQSGLLASALVSAVYSKALRYGEQSTVGLAVLWTADRASSFACDRDTCEVVKFIIVNYNRAYDTHAEVLLEHSL
jgi:hypothetical protein